MKTPGQTAYEAHSDYWDWASAGQWKIRPWDKLGQQDKEAWEKAARAVLLAAEKEAIARELRDYEEK